MRRSGGRGGCSEGCWQHRLLSRCYIEWVDEYLRRSTSCGFFFNQANLLVPSSSAVARLSHPPRRFPLAQIIARNESSCLCERERERQFQELRCLTLGHISPVIFSDTLSKLFRREKDHERFNKLEVSTFDDDSFIMRLLREA